MNSSKGKKKPSVRDSAVRGAIAGLIGGAAMTAAERVVLPRLPTHRRPRVVRWDKNVSAFAEKLGWEMSPRARTVAGVSTQLAYAALLGAGYLVARRHVVTSRAGQRLLAAALEYGALLTAPELPRTSKRRDKRAGRLGKLRRKVLDPITPPSIFGQTTSLALKALVR